MICDGRRVGPVSVAASSLERSHGLLGRDGVDGALLLQPAFVVHSFGMRFPIDVAFCDRHLRVISVITMPPQRLTRPRLRTWAVIEAQAGAFRRWHLAAGSRLAVEPDSSVNVGEPPEPPGPAGGSRTARRRRDRQTAPGPTGGAETGTREPVDPAD